jgi:predicted RNase H-like nuclease (RuvC/YqgF family)
MSEKYTSDVKAKENELSLMYRRLDDYVKQLAEKEMVENRVKFLDQQLANSHCTQKELKEDLEKALNRANMVSNSLINKNFVIFFALG